MRVIWSGRPYVSKVTASYTPEANYYFFLDLGTITLPPRRGLLCRVIAWLRGLF